MIYIRPTISKISFSYIMYITIIYVEITSKLYDLIMYILVK